MPAFLIPLLGSLLDKVLPDPKVAEEAKLKVMQMAQDGQLAELTANKEITLAQLGVNTEEAKTGNIFIAGWRPFIGWICGGALAYQYIGRPIWMALAVGFGYPPPILLPLDDNLWQLVLGMLGMGALRTYEKKAGVTT